MKLRTLRSLLWLALLLTAADTGAQQAPAPTDPDRLPSEPQVFRSSAQTFRVVPIKGLNRPFGMAFLPDGGMLVTERAGRLRLVRNGVVDPQPIAGMPEVLDLRLKGLQDIALHPAFDRQPADLLHVLQAEGRRERRRNRGARPRPVERRLRARRRARPVRRRRLVRHALGVAHRLRPRRQDLHDRRRADPLPRRHRAARGLAVAVEPRRQSAPTERRWQRAGRQSVCRQIRPTSRRSTRSAFATSSASSLHPHTGELWEHENGPMGGDEINIIKAGRNYGWPVVSYGRAYNGDPTGDTSGPLTTDHSAPGMEPPFLFWVPSIAPSGSRVLHRRTVQGLEGQPLRRRRCAARCCSASC